MVIVFSYLEDKPASLLKAQYGSIEIPFKNTAEIIATFLAVYYNDNQGSRTRAELSKMIYDPADKEMDIYQFIGKVNSLADKANIAKKERKVTLQEYVPTYLGNDLLTKSKDPDISYETYCSIVADAVLNQ